MATEKLKKMIAANLSSKKKKTSKKFSNEIVDLTPEELVGENKLQVEKLQQMLSSMDTSKGNTLNPGVKTNRSSGENEVFTFKPAINLISE